VLTGVDDCLARFTTRVFQKFPLKIESVMVIGKMVLVFYNRIILPKR
ncbi:hypothetical protein TorRG33x02_080640, partial [Trema orientale]